MHWIVLKIIKDVFTFHIICWIFFNRWRPNSQWSNPTCCISYTVNTMPADALATWGARPSAGMVLSPKPRIFHHQHQKSCVYELSNLRALKIWTLYKIKYTHFPCMGNNLYEGDIIKEHVSMLWQQGNELEHGFETMTSGFKCYWNDPQGPVCHNIIFFS